MFGACQEQSFKLTCETCEEVHFLTTSQEEVGTRLFLHAQHAIQKHQSIVIFGTDDTDIFIICLSLSSSINCNMTLGVGQSLMSGWLTSHNWPQHQEVKCVLNCLDFMHGLDVTLWVPLQTKER